MSTEAPKQTPEIPLPVRSGLRPLWIAAMVAVGAIAGLLVGWLVLGDTGSESAVDAAVEQEIIGLVDDWMTAWNDGDGQLAQSLFATDGRFVGGGTDMDGWSGEELVAGLERWGGTYTAQMIGSPLVIERSNSYHVVVKFQAFADYGNEYFELYNIVEENGALKFRYVEGWQALGWFQIAEGLPYRPVAVEG